MKKIISTILIGMILSPAAFAKAEKIEYKDSAPYIKALQEKTNDFNCRANLRYLLHYVVQIEVDRSGAQPAIYVKAESDGSRWDMAFYTTQNQQELTKVKVAKYRYEEVNRGTLVSPKYGFEWVPKAQFDCSNN